MTKLLIAATLILGFAIPAQAERNHFAVPDHAWRGWQSHRAPGLHHYPRYHAPYDYGYLYGYAYAYPAYAYPVPLNQPWIRPGHQPWKYYHTQGR